MKSWKLILVILAFAVFGCKESTSPEYNDQYNALTNLDIKASLALANEWKDTKPDIKSKFDALELTITFPDGRQVKKPMPANEMCVAVAPYINFTHACDIHNPSSCEGELIEKTFQVTANDEDGKTIIDGTMTSLKDGFVEMWLPRHKTITLNIAYNGLSAKAQFRTDDNSNTCITTMKLK
jgi:hypothetical protein